MHGQKWGQTPVSTAHRRMAAFLDVYGECRDSNISFGAVQTRSVCEPVGMANCVSLHARTKMGTDACEHRSQADGGIFDPLFVFIRKSRVHCILI